MNILDFREEIAKIDKQNVLGSVEALPEQCRHAWENASKIEVSENFRQAKAVVMCGMGGSGLGARVIESLYGNEIKIPLVRINDYHLPAWVDENTLVICSSYSGETEETIQNAKEAIVRKAKWMAIGAGHTLIKMAKEHQVPYYQINPQYNPSNQPRMAIGYSIIGQLVLAAKAGIIEFSQENIDQIVPSMQNVIEKTDVAKKLAMKMKNKIIAFISAQHLIGAVHVINNQLNENAKVFSADFSVPELNHHLMEGMSRPDSNKMNLFAFFVNSSLYSEEVKKRMEITQEIVQNQKIELFEYQPVASTKIAQVFEAIQFGAYVDLFLAILYGQDPAPIPWVDYFKTRLEQPLGK